MARGGNTVEKVGVVEEKTTPPVVKKEKAPAKEKAPKAEKGNATGLTDDQKEKVVAKTETAIAPLKWKLTLRPNFSPRKVGGVEYKSGQSVTLDSIDVIPVAFRDAWEIVEQPTPVVQAVPEIVEFDGAYFIVCAGKILNDLPLTEEGAQEMKNALDNP